MFIFWFPISIEHSIKKHFLYIFSHKSKAGKENRSKTFCSSWWICSFIKAKAVPGTPRTTGYRRDCNLYEHCCSTLNCIFSYFINCMLLLGSPNQRSLTCWIGIAVNKYCLLYIKIKDGIHYGCIFSNKQKYYLRTFQKAAVNSYYIISWLCIYKRWHLINVC